MNSKIKQYYFTFNASIQAVLFSQKTWHTGHSSRLWSSLKFLLFYIIPPTTTTPVANLGRILTCVLISYILHANLNGLMWNPCILVSKRLHLIYCILHIHSHGKVLAIYILIPIQISGTHLHMKTESPKLLLAPGNHRYSCSLLNLYKVEYFSLETCHPRTQYTCIRVSTAHRTLWKTILHSSGSQSGLCIPPGIIEQWLKKAGLY